MYAKRVPCRNTFVDTNREKLLWVKLITPVLCNESHTGLWNLISQVTTWLVLRWCRRSWSFCGVYPPLSEKAIAPHSSTLAWKIPWTEEPGELQSMGSVRVGHDWATSLSLFTFMHWRRKWQPTPVFLPGESQGRGSLVGCRLWGGTESDTTEAT